MFNKNFSKSKLLTYIDDTDHSIIGSSVDIQMVREIVNYFTLPSAGIKYYNTITPRTLRSGDLVFTVTPTADSYPVNIVGTDPDKNGKGNMVIGPFKPGDIKENTHIQPYTEDDFDRTTNGERTRWYKIGEVDYYGDNIYWSLGAIGADPLQFEDQSIELYSTPTQDIVFARDGTLIVFENDLRPQYTTIKLEPITQ
jgi:hypothetical protein